MQCFRGWRLVSERAVRPERVVEHAPPFDDHLRLSQRVEQLAVEQFVAQLAVERLAVAVLPGAARCDVHCFCSKATQPEPQVLRDHFGAVVGTDMFGDAVRLHQVGKHIDGVPRPDPTGDVDRQAFTGELVDDDHELDAPPVIGAIEHEVPRPHVVPVLGPQADAGAIVKPQAMTLGLLVRHPQAFAPPDAHHPAMADRPALCLQQGVNPAIAVAPVPTRQPDDAARQGCFIVSRLRLVAHRVPGNAQRLTDAPLGVAAGRLDMGHRLAPSRRA